MIKSFLTAFLVASLIFPPQAFANPPTPPESEEAGSSVTLLLPPPLRLTMPELSYSLLKEGQTLTASSDTILMSPEMFARITIEFTHMQDRHNLYLEQQLRISYTNNQLQYGLLETQNTFLEGELQRTNILLIRSQELNSSNNSGWFIALGVGLGVLASIGLVYAIAPAMK